MTDLYLFNLKYCRYEIHHTPREVRTIFPNGRIAVGSRDESSPSNIRQAQSEGYSGPNCVWRSLVEHELLHSLVAEALFDRPSVVLQVESGGEFTPLWERYEEECLVLCIQYWSNRNGGPPRPLELYSKRDTPPGFFRRGYGARILLIRNDLIGRYRPKLCEVYV